MRRRRFMGDCGTELRLPCHRSLRDQKASLAIWPGVACSKFESSHRNAESQGQAVHGFRLYHSIAGVGPAVTVAVPVPRDTDTGSDSESAAAPGVVGQPLSGPGLRLTVAAVPVAQRHGGTVLYAAP
eukprot:764967-Hanusia_phi.AAC.1